MREFFAVGHFAVKKNVSFCENVSSTAKIPRARELEPQVQKVSDWKKKTYLLSESLASLSIIGS